MESFLITFMLVTATGTVTSENITIINATLSMNETIIDKIITNENVTSHSLANLEVPMCNAALEIGQANYTTITNNINWTVAFLQCQKWLLSSENLCAIDQSRIFVPAYGRHYNDTDYYIDKGGVFVCVPFDLIDAQKERNSTNNSVTGYLTIIGISISNICLALHILAFLLIPEMHNLPGSNLAALAVTVFFSNLFFAVAQQATGNKVACIALSSFTLFFFLSSFLWMSVIGFETWRSLRMASIELRLCTKLMEQKRYIHYSLYAWLTPLIFVTIALIVDNVNGIDKSLKPGFGKRKDGCWFAESIAAIIFFVTPLVVVMTLNLVFFLWSVFVIHKHTDRLNQDKKFQSLLRKFSSYGKLAIITGLTWISGIIAFAVNNNVTTYIFIIFTAFYGLFIFVSFTCTKKVFRHLKKRFPFINKWIPAAHSTYSTSSKSDTHESKV